MFNCVRDQIVVPPVVVAAEVGLEAVLGVDEGVVVCVVVGSAVVRVDGLLTVVYADDEVARDFAVRGDDGRGARANVGDVRDAIPRIPGAVVTCLAARREP